ncbi:unnamed protein product [Caenorhabditis angaria]|uniref:Exonuclease domain-containing protein n=1 Tax=Caenorhabditis angaria TaxID=860376 RepID=A0A9P1MWD3_9PELO|nr:unnamed protein product [Caenorhabditis angaria]
MSIPSTSMFFQSQPPSWNDVQETEVSPRTSQEHINDAFSGMTMFDPTEQPQALQQQMHFQSMQPVLYTAEQLQYIAVCQYRQKLYLEFVRQQQWQLMLQNQQFAETLSMGSPTSSLTSSNSSSYENLSNASSTSPVEHNGTIYYSNPNDVTEMTYRDVYTYLWRKYKTSSEKLIKWGYPYFEDGKTSVTIQSTEFDADKNIWVAVSEKLRNCCRCKIVFKYLKNGRKSQGVCIYHPRSAKLDREIGARIHECCNEFEGKSKGCTKSPVHVYDQMQNTELETFVQTPISDGLEDVRNYNIFGMDCEMVYTKLGPAIARVSICNLSGDVVMDTLVKPPGEILDANTLYSGLTKEQIEKEAKISLEECHQEMFKYINEKTILIGHSLESDLKALRLSHLTIIDTAIACQSGKFKPSLRTLAQKYLQKSIQVDNPLNIGHDSIEDARTCVQIINKMSGLTN